MSQFLMALVLTTGLYQVAPVAITKADVEPAPVAPAPAPTDIAETRLVRVTAYTSAPEETDDTPFITASGQTVRDGIVATNLLPFGTKIRIPDYFGDKVFEVQDRMHERMKNYVDVWMDSKAKAFRFGNNEANIEILKSEPTSEKKNPA